MNFYSLIDCSYLFFFFFTSFQSSHDDLLMDAVSGIFVIYSIFDIFMLTYLANEMMLASDRLSLCLFESNFIEQTESCKKCVLILMERLKQPQKLVVGKIYALDLVTFTSVSQSRIEFQFFGRFKLDHLLFYWTDCQKCIQYVQYSTKFIER